MQNRVLHGVSHAESAVPPTPRGEGKPAPKAGLRSVADGRPASAKAEVGKRVAKWERVGYIADPVQDRGGGAPPTPPLRSFFFFVAPWIGTPTSPLTFRGSYSYALDAKKRLNVPPRFRAAFSDGVVLVKWFEPCVAVWPTAAFETFTHGMLTGLGPLSPERAKLTRFFAGSAYDAELDAAGRVTLGPPLLSHAGIDREAVVVGNLDRLEIWSGEAWAGQQEELSSQVARIAEGLGHPS